jgi:hypothetical protein
MQRGYMIGAVLAVLSCLAGTSSAQGADSPPPGPHRDWRAFHHRNDEYWAHWVSITTGWRDAVANRSEVHISAADVRSMRLLAGIGDDEPSDPIVSLTGRGMKVDRFLLVTAKPNGCLNISVYGEGWRHFEQVWSTDKLPNGREICQEPACSQPRVLADEKHEIRVTTVYRSTPDQPVCDRFDSMTYAPKKDSFELTDQDTGPAPCSLDSYDTGLNAAFRKAAGAGEILAVVGIWPALSPDKHVIVLKRVNDAVEILRMELREEASSAPMLYGKTKATALECFSKGLSVPVSVATLRVSEEKAQDLAMRLGKIDLRSDRCARRSANGSCAILLDGRSFTVQVGDHAPISLTDVKGLRGYVSQNPPLSEWVYKLIGETQSAKRIAAK